jgi:hypothetical protein
VAQRVSPSERVRAEIDALFSSDADLTSVLEEVTVLLMTARIELFRTGVWYGEGVAQLLDVLISVLVACSATLGGPGSWADTAPSLRS